MVTAAAANKVAKVLIMDQEMASTGMLLSEATAVMVVMVVLAVLVVLLVTAAQAAQVVQVVLVALADKVEMVVTAVMVDKAVLLQPAV